MSALSALPPTTTEQLRLPLERPVAGEAFVTSDSNAEAVRVLARWPDGVGAVQITLWIDAEGRIERTLLLGAAADDPRVQGTVRAISVGADDVVWLATQRGLAALAVAAAALAATAPAQAGVLDTLFGKSASSADSATPDACWVSASTSADSS